MVYDYFIIPHMLLKSDMLMLMFGVPAGVRCCFCLLKRLRNSWRGLGVGGEGKGPKVLCCTGRFGL